MRGVGVVVCVLLFVCIFSFSVFALPGTTCTGGSDATILKMKTYEPESGSYNAGLWNYTSPYSYALCVDPAHVSTGSNIHTSGAVLFWLSNHTSSIDYNCGPFGFVCDSTAYFYRTSLNNSGSYTIPVKYSAFSSCSARTGNCNSDIGEVFVTGIGAYSGSKYVYFQQTSGVPVKICCSYVGPAPSTPTLGISKTVSAVNIVNGTNASMTISLVGSGDTYVSKKNLDIVFVLDNSGSMAGDPIVQLKSATFAFIDKLNMFLDKIAYIQFNTSASGSSGLSPDFVVVKNNISALIADGNTNISGGIALANKILNVSTSTGVRVQILVSDGDANRKICGTGYSYTNCTYKYANESAKAGIKIYTIGLGADSVNTTMKYIANISGGKFYYAPTQNQLEDIFLNISRELINLAGTNLVVTDTLNVGVVPFNLPSNCNYDSVTRVISCSISSLSISETNRVVINFTITNASLTSLSSSTRVDYSDYNNTARTSTVSPQPSISVVTTGSSVWYCNATIGAWQNGTVTDFTNCTKYSDGGDPCCKVGESCDQVTGLCFVPASPWTCNSSTTYAWWDNTTVSAKFNASTNCTKYGTKYGFGTVSDCCPTGYACNFDTELCFAAWTCNSTVSDAWWEKAGQTRQDAKINCDLYYNNGEPDDSEVTCCPIGYDCNNETHLCSAPLTDIVCSDLKNEFDCDRSLSSMAEAMLSRTPGYTDNCTRVGEEYVFDQATGVVCTNVSSCSCQWNSVEGACSVMLYNIPNCPTGVLDPVPVCEWYEDSRQDRCGDDAVGKIIINYKAVGEGCTDQPIEYPCSVSVKLPFFDKFSFIIAGLAIGLVYFVIRRR